MDAEDVESQDLSKKEYAHNDHAEDEESQDSDDDNRKYLPQKATLTRGPTDDTANDDASVTSFSSWWTAGPANKDGIAKSSLDNIFGR